VCSQGGERPEEFGHLYLKRMQWLREFSKNSTLLGVNKILVRACVYICMYRYAVVERVLEELYASGGQQYTGKSMCVHVCMCACVHVCMCACVHVCMCACVHVQVAFTRITRSTVLASLSK
jgi:hypothetical protein